MSNEISFKDLLDHINKERNGSKTNCSVGLFVNDYYEDTSKEIENLIVKKPVVGISSFTEDNEVYYNINFQFKSYNDADYKQMWKFICKFVDKAKNESACLERGDTLEKIAGLTVTIVPEKYKGKYFVNIHLPYPETFSRTENAFDTSANISFICNDEGFQVLQSDDDVINPRSIEREVEQELLSELG